MASPASVGSAKPTESGLPLSSEELRKMHAYWRAANYLSAGQIYLYANPLEKRLQIAGTLVILGLLVEALCLFWARPISFVIFIAVGGLLLFLGILVYLYSLISAPTER